ncbi:MAG: MFS transporter, partial [Actinomyces sp.]|nr:MFS transporter [Actinomyces sp.]
MRRSSSPIVLLALPVYVPSLTWSTGIGALNSVVVLAGLSMQMSESWASAMVGIMGVAGVIASVPIGRMVDRIGDRSSFVIGGLIAVLAGTCALVCLRFPGINRAVVAFVIAMVAISIAGDMWQLARQSYVAESVPMTWRARSMSMLGGMSRLGRLIGPALASLAIVLGGIPGTFWFFIAATVLALSLIL